MGLCSMARKRDSAFRSLGAALRCPFPPTAQRTMSCGCGWVAVTRLRTHQDLLKEDAALMCCPGSGAGPRRWVRCGVSGGFFRPLFDRTKSGHTPNRILYPIQPVWEKSELGRFDKMMLLRFLPSADNPSVTCGDSSLYTREPFTPHPPRKLGTFPSSRSFSSDRRGD